MLRINANQIVAKLASIPKKQGFKTSISVLMAISAGLLVGFIVLLISSPGDAFQGLGIIFVGSLYAPGGTVLTGIGRLLYYATPIMLTGLSVGFAFKTGLFNIGASGQYMVGQFVAFYIGLTQGWLGIFVWPVAVLGGLLAGGIWGFIPGFFKAIFNVNEVITSIMFNYIGLYLTEMLIFGDERLFVAGYNVTTSLPSTSYTPKLGLDKLFPGSGVDAGFIIAIIVAIVIYIILNKTKFGYELKACGFNKHASKYAGINEKRNIMLAMAIAGALAGLAGAFVILAGGENMLGNTIKPDGQLSARGFTGISVALLGLSHPIGIIFSSFFIIHLEMAGQNIQALPYNSDIIRIIVAIIIYFSAFSLIFANFLAKRLQRKKDKANAPPIVGEGEGLS